VSVHLTKITTSFVCLKRSMGGKVNSKGNCDTNSGVVLNSFASRLSVTRFACPIPGGCTWIWGGGSICISTAVFLNFELLLVELVVTNCDCIRNEVALSRRFLFSLLPAPRGP